MSKIVKILREIEIINNYQTTKIFNKKMVYLSLKKVNNHQNGNFFNFFKNCQKRKLLERLKLSIIIQHPKVSKLSTNFFCKFVFKKKVKNYQNGYFFPKIFLLSKLSILLEIVSNCQNRQKIWNIVKIVKKCHKLSKLF